MPWMRLDDQIFLHPKIVAAGKDATLLHLSALAYASSQLTDGFIPSAAVRVIAATVNVSAKGVAALVEVGLWEVTDGGYAIHDFLQYNPSREETIAKRDDLSAKRAEAGRKGANKRWQTDGKPDGKMPERGHSVASDTLKQTDSPHPHPHPPVNPGCSNEHPRLTLATDKPPREVKAPPRNVHFDALRVACGYDEDATLTEAENTRIGKAAADIKRAGGTPEDITLRAVRYQAKYPGATLTALALANHWGEMASEPLPRASPNGSHYVTREEQVVANNEKNSADFLGYFNGSNENGSRAVQRPDEPPRGRLSH